MNGKMKAQVFYGPGDVRYKEIDIPKINSNEVLAKVKSALTCGSDLKTYKRGHPTMIKQGSVFGHEWAGEIVEVGRDVAEFKVGDRVVAMNSAPCFQCFYCKLELYSMCENIVYNNGAYAEYIKIPENILKINTIKLPDSLNYEEAALTEPLACVVHGVDKSDIKEGDIIAINGTGPIGLMWIALSKLKGARVIAVDLSEERLSIAKDFGADFTINASTIDDQVQAVKKLTDGNRGADIVVDATGVPKVWEMAIQMGRKGATINLFGGCPSGTSINVDTKLIHYSQLKILGIYHHTPYYVKKAFKLIENRQIDASKFITADVSLENLIDALEAMGKQKGIKYNIIS